MKILITGTPGSGKTSLANYANGLGDKRFVDADEIVGLCEWRETSTGKVLGLVTDYEGTQDDAWYAKYDWCWQLDFLEKYLSDNSDVIICGSSENVVESYKLFDKLFILKKSEDELLMNLSSPDRENPFGKTPEQRKNFMNWQTYLIEEAMEYKLTIIEGNEIGEVYNTVLLSI